MTAEATKVRVQRVLDLVETTLTEIANEHTEAHKAVSAIAEFFTALFPRLVAISNERLVAFMQHKLQPDD